MITADGDHVLRRIQRLLASLTSLDAFLSETMRSANEALDVRGSTVFLIDRDEQRQCLHMACLDGEVMQQLPTLEGFEYRACCRYHGSLDPLLRGQPTFAQAMTNRPLLDDQTINWLRVRGVLGLLRVPVIVQDSTAAILIFHKDDAEPFSPDKLDLAVGLGQLVAVAIHVSRLADEARESAVAKERETAAQERATTLARANAAMKQALEGVAKASDLEESRQFVLAALIQHLDAVEGSLWRYNDGEASLSLDLEFADGVFHRRDSVRFNHNTGHVWVGKHGPSLHANPELLAGDALLIDVASTDLLQETAKADLLAKSAQTLVTLPLFAANRHLGCLALLLRPRRELTVPEHELASALANQAALMLETSRLATESRIAAQRQSIAEERNRIGAEIHDGLQQTLYAIALQMGTATRMLERGDREAALRSMVAAAELAERGGTEARRSVQALRPRELEEQTDLAGALEDLCRKCSDEKLKCRFQLAGTPQPLTHALENTIFRVVQEALSNVLKHASASELAVSLEYLAAEVMVSIQDNGRGFELPVSHTDNGGYGFRTIRERAEIVSGSLSIESSPGAGTKVQLRVPIPRRSLPAYSSSASTR